MKKKDYLKMAGAVALTAVLTVTGTFAYLNKITETKKNTFNSSQNIETELKEEGYEKDKSENYIPGELIHKNPTMTNLSDSSMPIYVGVKLDFVVLNTDGTETLVDYDTFVRDYAEILTNGETGVNTQYWDEVEINDKKSKFYVYKIQLPTGDTSKPIFTDTKVVTGIKEVYNEKITKSTLYKVTYNGNNEKVYIPLETSEETSSSTVYYKKVGNDYVVVTDAYVLPKFEIRVTGYAIQGLSDKETDLGLDTAKTQLANLVNNQQ